MTQAQPLIQTLPMTLGAPMSDDPSNPTAIEIPLQIELPNGQTLFAAVALGGLPFDGQRQIAERMAAAWNAFTGVTTEEIKAPVKCLHQIAEPAVAAPWKDHRTAALVNDLRECAKTYANTEQLRERIATIVAPLCDQLKAAEHAATSQALPATRTFNSQIFGPTRDACEAELAAIAAHVTATPVAVFQALNRTLNTRGLLITIASAMTAAAPAEGVPATQGLDALQYRLIDHGEVIEAGDEFLRDDFTWQVDPRGIFVGVPHGVALRPARRALAAQTKQGGA